ncbi:major facilitator superfamily protein [Candidatus Planktophila vernalis]|uniref:Major facilitator superfamily protein n=1 Tax=Candidatus Planktophila vernalis TaxID=1884907 RepID=A0A249KTT8_9ACTN|nr:MFS transporter [Candidatus Planktophila vernalis]ASY20089.1 major facilitator superfamily protein [Candidatus Planktophila vernalis]
MSNDLFTSARRARVGLLATFFFMGVVSMAWVARIPEIRDANGLNNGQLGLILISSTIGAILGAQLTGRLVHSYGTQVVIRVAIIIMPIGLILMGFSTSPITLIFGLFIMGLGYSSMDIASNTQAVVIEKILGRRVMSSFHALWSSGAFATTVLGGSIANYVSPRDNLVGVGIVCFFLFIPAVRMLLTSDQDEHSGGEEETDAKIPFFGKSVLPLWGMGIGLLGGLIAEGAASDWGAILLRDDMGYGIGVNASAFAVFSLAMITARFLGDRALDHFGPRKTVLYGGYLGGIGLGAGIAIAVPLSDSQPILAFVIVNIGFACAGLGIGPMFPAYILAASEVPGIASSIAIARVGVIGIAGYFIGPSVTGALAQVLTLPVAMMYPVLMLLLAGYQSHIIKK